MNTLFYAILDASNNGLQPLYFMMAWSIIFFCGWSSWAAARNGINVVKRLHQIPCSNCQFFTCNYQLKCPVHPKTALTEDAINCLDYDPIGSQTRY